MRWRSISDSICVHFAMWHCPHQQPCTLCIEPAFLQRDRNRDSDGALLLSGARCLPLGAPASWKCSAAVLPAAEFFFFALAHWPESRCSRACADGQNLPLVYLRIEIDPGRCYDPRTSL